MKRLTKAELSQLIERREWPSVSIFMPTVATQNQMAQNPIRLKNLVRSAEEQLVSGGLRPSQAKEILQPAARLLDNDMFWHQPGEGQGLALFMRPGENREYRLPIGVPELAVVVDHFLVNPLLPMTSDGDRFFVLSLSQHSVRLYEGNKFFAQEIPVPNMPKSIDAAVPGAHPNQTSLQFHTRTPARGAGRTNRDVIMYGTSSADDDTKKRIRQYFQTVDHAIHDTLRGQKYPLVLAGVGYLHSIYKEVNSYAHILDQGIQGNPELMTADQIQHSAWRLVNPTFEQAQESALATYRTLHAKASPLASDRVDEIVIAAMQGRVDTLFVPLGKQMWGSLDGGSSSLHLHEHKQAGDQDMLDFAAVHTLATGGRIFAVDPGQMPDGLPLVAVYRY